MNPPINSHEKKTKVLVMKGGGVKGLAYVGAIRELQRFYNFDWFVGTSAGAIAALLLAAGYEVNELEKVLSNKNFSDFLDSKWKAPFRLIFQNGLFEARTFVTWIDQLLKDKIKSMGPLPLEKLPNRVTIYASRRYKKALIFDSTKERKETSASFAVRCSMSIPFIFTPQRDQGLRVLDGGMQNNYPVDELLANNPETDFIGLYLGNYYEGMPKEPSQLSDLLSIWTEAVDVEAVEKHFEQTIIIDPRPISTIDFNLTAIEKMFLLKSGRTAALRFLLNKNFPGGTSKNEVEKAENELIHLRQEVELGRRKRLLKFYKIVIGTVLTFIILTIGGVGGYRYFASHEISKEEDNIILPTKSNGNNNISNLSPATNKADENVLVSNINSGQNSISVQSSSNQISNQVNSVNTNQNITILATPNPNNQIAATPLQMPVPDNAAKINAPSPSPSPTTFKSRLSGIIFDENGKTLQGAKVTIDDFPEIKPVETASNGVFILENIPKKADEFIRIRVAIDGYKTYVRDVVIGRSAPRINLEKTK